MIGNIIKEYRLISLLGEGGMATVYLAEHQSLRHKVAVKLLNDEFVRNANVRKRFLAEARSLANLNHPNIIKVADMIDAGDIVAFMMEYVEGQTLSEYIAHNGAMNQYEIVEFFSQMVDAVAYVHSMGLIHRDIKPSNFMVTNDRRIKLLDFGIAKHLDAAAAEYTSTGMSQMMGTPMYMSPEQVKSTRDVTFQSDIYSLGVVLWQMCTGKKPYEHQTDSIFELQMRIVSESLGPSRTIFDPVISRATQKEPSNRFSSCSELKNAIHHPGEKTILENVAQQPSFQSVPVKKNYIWLIVLIVILLGAAIGGGIYIYNNQTEESNEGEYEADETYESDEDGESNKENTEDNSDDSENKESEEMKNDDNSNFNDSISTRNW